MCGIFFVSEVNERTRRVLPFLAYGMENRGDDSWGCTNGRDIVKHATSIIESFEIPAEWDGDIYIGHTRAKSVGDVKLENAHPFKSIGTKTVIGVHNGGVSNWVHLNSKYSRKHEVDSQHIFEHIANELPTKEIDMRGVIAWAENENREVIHIARSSSQALYVVELETGEYIGASLQSDVIKSVRMAGLVISYEFTFDDETHYEIKRTGVYKREPMKFGSAYTVQVIDHKHSRFDWVHIPATADVTVSFHEHVPIFELCMICHKNLIKDSEEDVVCYECLEKTYKVITKHFDYKFLEEAARYADDLALVRGSYENTQILVSENVGETKPVKLIEAPSDSDYLNDYDYCAFS